MQSKLESAFWDSVKFSAIQFVHTVWQALQRCCQGFHFGSPVLQLTLADKRSLQIVLSAAVSTCRSTSSLNLVNAAWEGWHHSNLDRPCTAWTWQAGLCVPQCSGHLCMHDAKHSSRDCGCFCMPVICTADLHCCLQPAMPESNMHSSWRSAYFGSQSDPAASVHLLITLLAAVPTLSSCTMSSWSACCFGSDCDLCAPSHNPDGCSAHLEQLHNVQLVGLLHGLPTSTALSPLSSSLLQTGQAGPVHSLRGTCGGLHGLQEPLQLLQSCSKSLHASRWSACMGVG